MMTCLSFCLPLLTFCLAASLIAKIDAGPKAITNSQCVPKEIMDTANSLDEETLRDHYGKIACAGGGEIKLGKRSSALRIGARKLPTPVSRASLRVVNGKPANVSQWPWMVALEMGENGCGGVLVNKRFVVTAEHCTNKENAGVTKPSDIKITAGIITLKPKEDTAQEFEATEIIAHPTADIAILRLNKDATLSRDVWPIWFRGNDEHETTSQLWGPNHLHQDETGEAAIAGWGLKEESGTAASNRLINAYVRLRHDQPCADLYGKEVYKGKNQYCAGGTCDTTDTSCKETDACQGDSGGPLMYNVNDHWVLLGVTSMGNGCAKSGVPGIYTWTYFIQAWIEENIKL